MTGNMKTFERVGRPVAPTSHSNPSGLTRAYCGSWLAGPERARSLENIDSRLPSFSSLQHGLLLKSSPVDTLHSTGDSEAGPE
jgi:hypothetical protein